jgi:quinol monooxygenase YgiN
MTTPTDDNRELLTLFASMKALRGKEQELRQVLEDLVSASLNEEGCVNYDLHQDLDDPGSFHFYENWATPELWAEHNDSPHVTAFGARHDELLEGGAANGVTLVKVKRIF